MGIEDEIISIKMRLFCIEEKLDKLLEVHKGLMDFADRMDKITGQPKDRQDKEKAIKDSMPTEMGCHVNE